MLNSFMKYLFIAIIFLGLGYWWAYKAYVPHIQEANHRLTEYSQLLALEKMDYFPNEINIKKD